MILFFFFFFFFFFGRYCKLNARQTSFLKKWHLNVRYFRRLVQLLILYSYIFLCVKGATNGRKLMILFYSYLKYIIYSVFYNYVRVMIQQNFVSFSSVILYDVYDWFWVKRENFHYEHCKNHERVAFNYILLRIQMSIKI